MVQNGDWGPPLWRILHILAEKLGRQTIPMLATDEIRAWILLLRDLEPALPCQLCRRHYREWRKEHTLEELGRGAGLGFRDMARRWLYDLHERVNDRRGLELTGRVAWETLPEMYGGPGRSIQSDVETFFQLESKAQLERAVDSAAVRQFRERLGLVRRLLGA